VELCKEEQGTGGFKSRNKAIMFRFFSADCSAFGGDAANAHCPFTDGSHFRIPMPIVNVGSPDLSRVEL
jgi:hypothetical protein